MKRVTMTFLSLFITNMASAFEISKWSGTWERYSAEGDLVERIIATNVLPGKILSSKVEYFNKGTSVATGAAVMSKHDGKINMSFHVTGGSLIELTEQQHDKDSVVLKLTRTNASTGETQSTMYTRFKVIENGNVIQQTVYEDAELNKLLLDVNFNKVNG